MADIRLRLPDNLKAQLAHQAELVGKSLSELARDAAEGGTSAAPKATDKKCWRWRRWRGVFGGWWGWGEGVARSDR